MSNLESKIKGDDKDAIEAALKELETVSSELGKVAYEQAAAAGNQAAEDGAASNKSGGDDDVIDADFTVKDDDK